jgi:hypothetical protein
MKQLHPKTFALHKALLFAVCLAFPQSSFASCSNPYGQAGDIVYNANHNMMQFCNDTNWLAMAGGGGGSVTDTLADLSCGNDEIAKWDGDSWECAADEAGSATPSGAAGAVQFSDGTAFASDIANFFWDDAANELGIGTNNPGEKLDVWNNANSAAYAVVGGLRVTNNAGGTNYSRLYMGQATTNKMFLETADQANAKGELLLQPWGGNVGIGNADPTTALDVTGTVTATTFAGSGASLTALNASNLGSGTVPTARLGSGTANNTTFLRGDNTWAAPSAAVNFGSYTARNVNTNYTAATAGMVVASMDSESKCTISGLINGSTIIRDTTAVDSGDNTYYASITFPVPNGATYRVNESSVLCGTLTMNFVPFQ